MKEISKIMYKKYALNKLKYDFMGYIFENKEQLSFHHLIVPHRLCKQKGLGDGYWEWNGALLVRSTAHNYLHVIERYDLDMFSAITSEMIDENIKGHLDLENIRAINDILCSFERQYINYTTNKGNFLIKEEYFKNRIIKSF